MALAVSRSKIQYAVHIARGEGARLSISVSGSAKTELK